MIKADSLTPSAPIGAMEKGNFYASTGVELRQISVSNSKLYIEIKPHKQEAYTISFIGCKKASSESEMLKTVKGTKVSFPISNNFLFVRAKITSSSPPKNAVI